MDEKEVKTIEVNEVDQVEEKAIDEIVEKAVGKIIEEKVVEEMIVDENLGMELGDIENSVYNIRKTVVKKVKENNTENQGCKNMKKNKEKIIMVQDCSKGIESKRFENEIINNFDWKKNVKSENEKVKIEDNDRNMRNKRDLRIKRKIEVTEILEKVRDEKDISYKKFCSNEFKGYNIEKKSTFINLEKSEKLSKEFYDEYHRKIFEV